MGSQTQDRTKNTTAKILEAYSRQLIEAGSLLLLLMLILVGVLTRKYTFSLGVFVGGVVALVNHYGLYKSLRAVLSAAAERGEKGGVPQTLLSFYVRLILSGILIFLALKGGFADPLGILIGASVVVVNSLILGLALLITDRGA
jgi:hypothetical protein